MALLTIQPDGTDGLDAPIVNGPYAAINYASQTFMFLGSFFVLDVTTYHRGVLSFDISAAAVSPAISSATLSVYSDGSGDTPGTSTFTAKRLTRTNWTEAGVTWNRYDGTNNWTTAGGDATSTNQATAEAVGNATVVTFDVTAMLRDAIAAGLTRLHVLLSGPEADGASNYYAGFTSETSTAAERPKLEIATVEAPDEGWTAAKRYAHWEANERASPNWTAPRRYVHWEAK